MRKLLLDLFALSLLIGGCGHCGHCDAGPRGCASCSGGSCGSCQYGPSSACAPCLSGWQTDAAGDSAYYDQGRFAGWYIAKAKKYYAYDATAKKYAEGVAQTVAPPATSSDDALDEVNAYRSRRGLRPFLRDRLLTLGAVQCARLRAKHLISGHTANDFAGLPAGAQAAAAGCAAWAPGWGWGACCTYDPYTYAGAAWAMGSDGQRYMHLFVR